MPSTETDTGMPPPYPHGHPQSQQHPGMPTHQQRYPPPYGPPPGHMQSPPHGGYHYGPPPSASQYGNPQGGMGIPPHQWTGGMPPGHPPPPGPPAPPPGQSGAYPSRGQRSLSPDRSGNWNGYRGAPPPHKVTRKSPDKEEDSAYWHGQTSGPPSQYDTQPAAPPSYHGSGYGPRPSGWQAGHSAPPLHSPTAPPPPNVYSGSWTGKTPPRRQHRDSYSSRHEGDVASYVSRGQQSHVDDDCASSSAGGSTKDKGRGSYKCGRCGVPKKGHVCPYQPKLKRRPDEPPPETRNAAVQVEMDEFMTLRRLNIRIQGFPESYVTEPYMTEMVVGEASHPLPTMSHSMDVTRSNMLLDTEQRMTLDTINDEPSRHSSSPMRDAAIGDGNLNDDPLEQAV